MHQSQLDNVAYLPGGYHPIEALVQRLRDNANWLDPHQVMACVILTNHRGNECGFCHHNYLIGDQNLTEPPDEREVVDAVVHRMCTTALKEGELGYATFPVQIDVLICYPDSRVARVSAILSWHPTLYNRTYAEWAPSPSKTS